jgi:acyl-CoA dehydrogenase
MRFFIQPLSPSHRGPSDAIVEACSNLITEPSAARERLVSGLYRSKEGATDGVALVERAFALTVGVQPIRDRMRAAHVREIDQGVKQGTINADEAAQLRKAAEAVAAAIAVDDFAPEEFAAHRSAKGEGTSRKTTQRPAAE